MWLFSFSISSELFSLRGNVSKSASSLRMTSRPRLPITFINFFLFFCFYRQLSSSFALAEGRVEVDAEDSFRTIPIVRMSSSPIYNKNHREKANATPTDTFPVEFFWMVVVGRSNSRSIRPWSYVGEQYKNIATFSGIYSPYLSASMTLAPDRNFIASRVGFGHDPTQGNKT